MNEDLQKSSAEKRGSATNEEPLTPEELESLGNQYAVVAPPANENASTSKQEGLLTELEPDPGTGQRRVEIGGQKYIILANDSGKIVEMLPFSLDAAGNTEYGDPVKSESLIAQVDPETAKEYEEKMSTYTAENYQTLDKDGRDQLMNNFYSGSESEIGDRIMKLYESGTSDSDFGRRVYAKVGYNKGQFQIGFGFN